MDQQELTIQIAHFRTGSELPEHLEHLLETAHGVAQHAYAPYSHYHVGAAMLLDDGRVIAGSNQENASFPVGLCAERVALANVAMTSEEPVILALAISVSGEIAAPCGMCRQALLEQENRQGQDIMIYLQGSGPQVTRINSVKDLLPLPFYSKALGK